METRQTGSHNGSGVKPARPRRARGDALCGGSGAKQVKLAAKHKRPWNALYDALRGIREKQEGNA